MYKTKMIKVYLPSFQLCIFSLIVNLLVQGIQPLHTAALDSVPSSNTKQAKNNASATIEPEILSEINRVRTNPQGYAKWLEEQKQHYDGIWLKLPGEKPIRTNRGLKALNEAIAFLQKQQPLSPLPQSEATAANASDKLENFATSKNIQYISYGRTTPKGIVMSLVVDDLFPDRRRRKSLLSPDADNTGVVCKSDPTYAKVCAIAYSDSPVDSPQAEPNIAESNTEDKPATATPEVETTASKPELPRAKPEPVKTDNTEPATEEPQQEEPQQEEPQQEVETTGEALPAPPIPQNPPTPEVPEVEVPEVNDSSSEAEEPVEDSQEVEVARAEETEEAEAEVEEEVEEDEEDEEIEDLEEDEEAEAESADNQENEETEEAEAEVEDTEDEDIATNSDSSRILENVERGTLEEGDRVIAEDGSFYDSYPLEAKSDESFIIYLESEEFDAFVALVDAQGNIIDQNDDIDEENSNSRIRVTIPENGTYNVIVNAYDEGGTGEYVLTVRR